MTRDYIPGGDLAFLEWAKNLSQYAEDNFANWEIPDPKGFLHNPLHEFETGVQKMQNPNSGKVDTLAKTEARRALEKACRSYVQGFLAKNPLVTDIDRKEMAITIRDAIPTTVPPPSAQVEGNIAFPGIGLVEIVKIQMAGGKIDRRSDYGVRIYYGILSKAATHDKFRLSEPPTTGDDLPHSVFTRKKSHLFDFTGDSGCAVYFCMRYENSKGEVGPWGPIIEAHVP